MLYTQWKRNNNGALSLPRTGGRARIDPADLTPPGPPPRLLNFYYGGPSAKSCKTFYLQNPAPVHWRRNVCSGEPILVEDCAEVSTLKDGLHCDTSPLCFLGVDTFSQILTFSGFAVLPCTCCHSYDMKYPVVYCGRRTTRLKIVAETNDKNNQTRQKRSKPKFDGTIPAYLVGRNDSRAWFGVEDVLSSDGAMTWQNDFVFMNNKGFYSDILWIDWNEARAHNYFVSVTKSCHRSFSTHVFPRSIKVVFFDSSDKHQSFLTIERPIMRVVTMVSGRTHRYEGTRSWYFLTPHAKSIAASFSKLQQTFASRTEESIVEVKNIDISEKNVCYCDYCNPIC